MRVRIYKVKREKDDRFMNIERSYNRRHMWKSVTALAMMGAGVACFIISCVAAMIIVNKE